jgi:hypothetical protein
METLSLAHGRGMTRKIVRIVCDTINRVVNLSYLVLAI